jgi:hypothetical protein
MTAPPEPQQMTATELAAYRRELEHAIAFFDRQHPSPRPAPTCKPGSMRSPPVKPSAPGAPMREQHLASQLSAVPGAELRATRRDLETSIAMMRPGSAMHAPATTYLAAIKAELDRRTRHHAPIPARPELGTP